MHPRSIYRAKPNFALLAKKHDFLAPYVTSTGKGKEGINFKDPAALRALSRALLLNDFDLDVVIPESALVPTVPLRLNYILWLEDLLVGVNTNYDGQGVKWTIRGIDVGTGATAVYALLGARKNGWEMTGTELDPEYVEIARQNVKRNGLEDKIKIIPAATNSEILTPILSEVGEGHFFCTLCNPPFFGSEEETNSAEKGRRKSSEDSSCLRPLPSTAKTGKSTELFVEEGEVKFVKGLIDESLKNPRKVLIFTTMLGIKRDLKPLITYLRSQGITNFTTTEFVQGKTTRWGLAWSFMVNLLPPDADLIGNFPKLPIHLNFLTTIQSYLEDLKPLALDWTGTSLEFVANENTWSGQRRKRRMEERLRQESQGSEEMAVVTNDENEVTSTTPPVSLRVQRAVETEKPILLHCFFNFVREDDDGSLLMRYKAGTLGKEGLHQILQFLKNRYDKEPKSNGNSQSQSQ